MRPATLATVVLLLLAGCAARLGTHAPGGEFAAASLRKAQALGPRVPGDAAGTPDLFAGPPDPNRPADPARDRAPDAEGLLWLDAEAEQLVRAFADPAAEDEVLGARALDRETLLLAAYARSPAVQSARASWRAALRMLDQATYLEGVLARYRAFTAQASPTGVDRPMVAPVFPYPGTVALRGAMIALEVRMAAEGARMRLRDALSACVMAYVEALAKDEELPLREEQVALTERLLVSARARAAAGSSPNAEVLEAEAELAMARNELVQTTAEAAAAKGRLNTLLGREPAATLRLAPAGRPAPVPSLPELLRLAGTYSPEIRMARAEAERTAVAIRMGEAMLLSPGPPRPPSAGPSAPMGPAAPAPGPARTPATADGMAPMGGGAAPGGRAAPAPAGAPADPAGMSDAEAAPPVVTFAQDLAWLHELRERKVALDRAADESRRAVERSVLDAQLAHASAERMLAVAESTAAPLALQALTERLRAYETGRSEFGELVGALGRVLETRRRVVASRRMLHEAEARLWMAVGARPAVAASLERAR